MDKQGKKLVVINSSTDKSYNKLFDPDKFIVINEDNPDSVYLDWGKIDLVLLVGAVSDVDPSLYGEEKNKQCGRVDRLQDLNANIYYNRCTASLIPMIGICKGAQQLCVFDGGKLIQHVDRVSIHTITINDATFQVMADHHQVMCFSIDDFTKVIGVNTETYYPEVFISDFCSKVVGIQFHPEWSPEGSPPREYFNQVLKELLNV